MLIVIGKATVGNGAIDAAREAFTKMVTASNAEAGCISYAYALDVLDPSVMHIVEKWQDDAALVAHFQAPHMAEFQTAIASLDVKVSEVMKYQADEGSSLI